MTEQNEELKIIRKESSLMDFSSFDLKIQNLIIRTLKEEKLQQKLILKGISCHFKAGQMTGIIGSSGAGKTTFLNLLAGRFEGFNAFEYFGQYFINNVEVKSLQQVKNLIGYVSQDDILDGRMTPQQTFEFYYDLRRNLDENFTFQEQWENKKHKIDELIKILRLQEVRNTVIGSEEKWGLSGGERKRVCIGIELIKTPSLLFLDEPTTGLDSSNAFNIIQILNSLALENITVICTIHQPSKRMLKLFDKILILSEGEIAFEGASQEMDNFLNEFQIKKKQQISSIDFFVQYIDWDDIRNEVLKQKIEQFQTIQDQDINQEVEQIYQLRLGNLLKKQKQKTNEYFIQKLAQKDNASIDELLRLAQIKNQQQNFFKEVWILTKKKFYLLTQDYLKFIVFFIFGLIAFGLNWLVNKDLGSIQENPVAAYSNRSGYVFLIQSSINFQSMGISLATFLPLKLIFVSDFQGKTYRRSSFFISCFLYLLPILFVMNSIFATCYLFTSMLNRSDGFHILWFYLLLVLGSGMFGFSIGFLATTLANNIKEVGIIMSIIVLPFFIVAGFFAQIKSMSWPLRIFSFISGQKYVLQGLILNEFTNYQEYIDNCPVKGPASVNCNPLAFFDYYEKEIWLNFLLSQIVIYFLIVMTLIIFAIKYRDIKVKKIKDRNFIQEFIQGDQLDKKDNQY